MYERLAAMRHKSDLARKQGDYEIAYIMLKRWLDSVEWLRRTPVKNGKSVYATSMTADQVRDDVSKITSPILSCELWNTCVFTF